MEDNLAGGVDPQPVKGASGQVVLDVAEGVTEGSLTISLLHQNVF